MGRGRTWVYMDRVGEFELPLELPVSRRSVAGDVAWQSMQVWHPICVDSCTKGRRSYARRS